MARALSRKNGTAKRGYVLVIRTRFSGCVYGKGQTSKAFTRLNIAAFPPMPNASETVEMAVNTGVHPYMRWHIAGLASIVRGS
jgi:hypothetical protein